MPATKLYYHETLMIINMLRKCIHNALIIIRDTAKYPPLMKTSKLSNPLKYLTQAYLG